MPLISRCHECQTRSMHVCRSKVTCRMVDCPSDVRPCGVTSCNSSHRGIVRSCIYTLALFPPGILNRAAGLTVPALIRPRTDGSTCPARPVLLCTPTALFHDHLPSTPLAPPHPIGPLHQLLTTHHSQTPMTPTNSCRTMRPPDRLPSISLVRVRPPPLPIRIAPMAPIQIAPPRTQ
jgi:hypothetical protein